MNNKLPQYLNYFQKQKEAGLIIVEDGNLLEEIKNNISQNGFNVTSSWREAVESIKNSSSTCLVIDINISKNDYDLIAQYFARTGAIQIMDKNTMELISVQFDPFQSHFLLLTDKDSLSNIEKTYSIKDKVGLIERI